MTSLSKLPVCSHCATHRKRARNFELPAFPGLIVKESYWRWPERNLGGNAIDFFVQIFQMNFHDAMRQIYAGN